MRQSYELHIGPALLVPYAKMLGLKVVFTHHGPDYDRDKWGIMAKMVLKWGERMGCLFADEVIVISEVIRNLIRRKYGRTEQVHLIYNGVPCPDYTNCPEYFRELGITERNYILGMCRFVPEKNLHHLVEAFRRVDKKGCRLVLAGDTDFACIEKGSEGKRGDTDRIREREKTTFTFDKRPLLCVAFVA